MGRLDLPVMFCEPHWAVSTKSRTAVVALLRVDIIDSS
jgi:hypothetical protein